MAKAKFLSQAASFMLNAGEVELSSYFIRKIQENEIKSERNNNGGLLALTPSITPSEQANRDKKPQEKKDIGKDESVFPGYFCHICGKLQNPLLVKFRVRPKIRKRKHGMKIIEKCTIDGEQKKCRHPKNARKTPFVSSKCYYCNQIQKLVCHPPTDLKEGQLLSNSRNDIVSRRSNESGRDSPKKKKMQNITETPRSALGVTSKSSCSRKKQKSSNNTLAKLLSAKKKTPVSPNLKSFLFSS